MESRMPHRGAFVQAFAAAGLAAACAWVCALTAYTLVVDGPGRALPLTPYLLIGAVLFGGPLIMAVLLAIGLPAFLILRRLGRITFTACLSVGMLGAVLTRELVRLTLAQPELGYLPLPVTLFTGMAAAVVWWTAWSRRSLAARD